MSLKKMNQKPRNQNLGPKKTLGNLGEKLATAHLRQKKHRILAQNLRTKIGEVDILTLDGKTLVIVEVKTKTGGERGQPVEMVDFFKQKKLLRLANEVHQRYPQYEIRIDVVAVDASVEPPSVEHFENIVEERV